MPASEPYLLEGACTGEANARQFRISESRSIVECVERRPHLRVRTSPASRPISGKCFHATEADVVRTEEGLASTPPSTS